jgi:hypothetical protein
MHRSTDPADLAAYLDAIEQAEADARQEQHPRAELPEARRGQTPPAGCTCADGRCSLHAADPELGPHS